MIRQMDRTEVTVTVKGLNFNTPDTVVIEYLNKHGKVVTDKVIYEVAADGPFKGLKNGNRKYKVILGYRAQRSQYQVSTFADPISKHW